VHVQDLSRRPRSLRLLELPDMKKTSLIALLVVAATAVTAGPALAKTSLTKGKQICEAAAKAQTPAPKSVRTDSDATRVSDSTLTYTLRIKAADDTAGVLLCTVDRQTDAPTLTAR